MKANGEVARWAPRRTVRLRLTLLYVGLFLASGACLLVITYFLVARQLPAAVAVRTSQGAGTSGTLVPGARGWWPRARRRRTACRPPSR